MEPEFLKQRFKTVDFIMSAGDVSNRYLDYLVSVLDKDIICVNGNHIYHKDYPITFAKVIDGKFLKYWTAVKFIRLRSINIPKIR